MTSPKLFFKEYKVFGAQVREARRALGLSLAKLGQLVDLSEGSLRSLELGKQGVYLRTAIQIANLLNISLDDTRKSVAQGMAAGQIKEKLVELKKQELEAKIEEVKALNQEYEKLKKLD